MKTHVSFTRRSPTLKGDPPYGKDIALKLAAYFRSRGYEDIKLQSLDYAYYFYAPEPSRKCYIVIGLVGDDPQQWLICCDIHRGLLSRILKRPPDRVTIDIIAAIHKFLTHDDAVSSIQWYSAKDWHNSVDRWTDNPRLLRP